MRTLELDDEVPTNVFVVQKMYLNSIIFHYRWLLSRVPKSLFLPNSQVPWPMHNQNYNYYCYYYYFPTCR